MFYHPRRPVFLLFLILLLLPLHPWVRPAHAADPWPLFTEVLDRLGAGEVIYGGWMLFGKDAGERPEQYLEAWTAAGEFATALQTAPGTDGLQLLSFHGADWRTCPALIRESGRMLKGWTVEAYLPGEPVDAERLARQLAEHLQVEVHSTYTDGGHVNLTGYSALLPVGFRAAGTALNLNLDLRYQHHRRCLRLQVGIPVLPSPLTPVSTRF